MKVTVVAQKSTRHRGKLYRKGETFAVPPQTARIFGALGKARIAAETDLGNGVPKLPPLPTVPAAPPVPPVPVAPKAVEPDPLADLRAEYEGVTGEAPDRRWGEARLRTEIRDHRDRRIAGGDPKDDDGTGDLL